MTKAEAIESASHFARERGYDPEQYDVKAAKKGLRWKIDFQRKSEPTKPRPGDFFTVFVDVHSKSVERLIPGK